MPPAVGAGVREGRLVGHRGAEQDRDLRAVDVARAQARGDVRVELVDDGGLAVVAARAGDGVVVGIAAVRGDPVVGPGQGDRERARGRRAAGADRHGAGEDRSILAIRVGRAVEVEGDRAGRRQMGAAQRGRIRDLVARDTTLGRHGGDRRRGRLDDDGLVRLVAAVGRRGVVVIAAVVGAIRRDRLVIAVGDEFVAHVNIFARCLAIDGFRLAVGFEEHRADPAVECEEIAGDGSLLRGIRAYPRRRGCPSEPPGGGGGDARFRDDADDLEFLPAAAPATARFPALPI